MQCLVCVNYTYWHHTPLPQDGYPLYVKDIYFIGTPPAIKKSQGILRFLKQETLKVCTCTCTCYHCIHMFEYLYRIQLTYTVHCVIVNVFSHVFNFLYIHTHRQNKLPTRNCHCTLTLPASPSLWVAPTHLEKNLLIRSVRLRQLVQWQSEI